MTIDLRKSREPVPDRPRTARLFERDPNVSPWLFWPARIAAVVVMVPVLLAWELVMLVRRGVRRYVVRPLIIALHYALVVPARALGRALRWIARRAYAVMAWLGHYLVVVPARFLGRALVRLTHYLFVIPARLLGRALVWIARNLIGVPARLIGRGLLWIGRHAYTALAWLGHHLIVVPARGLLWIGRHARTALALLARYGIAVPARAIGRVLRWAARYAGATVVWLARYLVAVPARAVGRVLRATWRLRVPLGRFLYTYAVRPLAWLGWHLLWVPVRTLGRAVRRYLLHPLWTASVAAGHAIGWAWRNTIVASGRWIRSAVIAPARDLGRGVLVAFGLRRS